MSKASNVYIVTSEEYSDYGIDAVCSTRAIAKHIAAQISGSYCTASVEVWPLNMRIPPIYTWFARVALTGALVSVDRY